MRIKKGDQVQIIAGKDKGKKGKVLRTLPGTEKIVVEGLNMMKKHMRPRREREQGQRIEIAAPLPVSNVMLICPNCGKMTRIGYVINDKRKSRMCKKCNKEMN